MNDFEEKINREKLIKTILKKSVSSDWDDAQHEWYVDFIDQKKTHCPCGHPIVNRCHLVNNENSEKMYVGNVCVKNFVGIDMNSAFSCLNRIKEDLTSNVNAPLLECIKNKNILKKLELKFLLQMQKRRKFTEKQMIWKIDLNKKILKAMIHDRVAIEEVEVQRILDKVKSKIKIMAPKVGGDYTLTFGRYHGCNLSFIKRVDESYYDWLTSIDKNEVIENINLHEKELNKTVIGA